MAHAQGEKFALLVERQFGLGDGIARLRVADEGLRTRRLPVHRAADFARSHQQRDIFRIDRRLHAETAADVVGDDAQLFVRHAHDGGRLAAQRIGALRAGAQRVALARRVVLAGGAARLERGDHHALVDDAHARHVRRALDDLVDLALVLFARHRARPIDAEIAGRIGNSCVAAFIADSRSTTGVSSSYSTCTRSAASCAAAWLSATTIATRSPTCMAVSASTGRNGIAILAPPRPAHRRMARNAADAGRLDVLRGEHRQHALGLARLIGVDRQHPRVRVRRAHEGGIGRIGKARVVHETAGAAHQGIVFDARRTSGACGAVRVMGSSGNSLAGPRL